MTQQAYQSPPPLLYESQSESQLPSNSKFLKKSLTDRMTNVQLQKQAQGLVKELEEMNRILNHLISQKCNSVTGFETISQQVKAYHKLNQKLKQELRDFQWMLTPDYKQRLNEELVEAKKQRKMLREEMKAVQKELGKTKGYAGDDQDQVLKQIYELQLQLSEANHTRKAKQNQYQELLAKINKKKQQEKAVREHLSKIEHKLEEEKGTHNEISQKQYDDLNHKKIKALKILTSIRQHNELKKQQKNQEIKNILINDHHVDKMIIQMEQKKVLSCKEYSQLRRKHNKMLNRSKSKQHERERLYSQLQRYHSKRSYTQLSPENDEQELLNNQRNEFKSSPKSMNIYQELSRNHAFFTKIKRHQTETDQTINQSLNRGQLNDSKLVEEIKDSKIVRLPMIGNNGRNRKLEKAKKELCQRLKKEKLALEEDQQLQTLIYSGLDSVGSQTTKS